MRLEAMMAKRNLTVSMPEELIKKTKVAAARRGVSMNAFIQEALEERLRESSGYAAAMRRQLETMESGVDLGLKGKRIRREDVHER